VHHIKVENEGHKLYNREVAQIKGYSTEQHRGWLREGSLALKRFLRRRRKNQESRHRDYSGSLREYRGGINENARRYPLDFSHLTRGKKSVTGKEGHARNINVPIRPAGRALSGKGETGPANSSRGKKIPKKKKGRGRGGNLHFCLFT